MIELGGERQSGSSRSFQAQVAPFRLSPGYQHIRGVVRYLKADLRRASLRIVVGISFATRSLSADSDYWIDRDIKRKLPKLKRSEVLESLTCLM